MATRRYNINLAGQNFGFSLPSQADEEGKAQTETVLSEYFPELKLSYSAKGTRGGRLGRASEQMTPELTLKQREAAAAGSATGAPTPTTVNLTVNQAAPAPAPAPAPTPQAPKLPDLKSLVGSPQEPGVIGGGAIRIAQKQGFTPEQIRQAAKEQNLKVNVLGEAQLTGKQGPDLWALGPQPGGVLGSAAVRKAKQDLGLSEIEIRSLAGSQGLRFNVLGESELTGKQAPNLWSLVSGGGGPNQEMGVFGGLAVRRARNEMGLSNTEIRALAASQGLRFNQQALAELG